MMRYAEAVCCRRKEPEGLRSAFSFLRGFLLGKSVIEYKKDANYGKGVFPWAAV